MLDPRSLRAALDELERRTRAIEQQVGRLPARYGAGGDRLWFRFGVVVCTGPQEDEDFPDNRYWVALAAVSNDQADAADAKVEITESATGTPPAQTIVAVTNLFEDNCATHNVRPGTRVAVFAELDRGKPQRRRYVMLVADEGTCRSAPCGAVSSSSSSSSASSDASDSDSSAPSTPSSGSEKSSAIVPASWSKGGYAALYVTESPNVRFEDVVVTTIQQRDATLVLDARFVEVCEPGSLEAVGVTTDVPALVGVRIDGSRLHVAFDKQRPGKPVRLAVKISAIRRGFANVRFGDRTAAEFAANERFLGMARPR